ncbi:MAG: DHHA1 domain-containing protein [Chloroflexota bacterium]|nr:DHHA1 domain-containing protein [Chloroflexota bacterium]
MVLGPETHQAGSLVAPDRLRFDFTSLDAVSAEQLVRIGEIVNAEVLLDRPVTTATKPYAEAVEGGATALFGEKYGEVVRVVTVPGFSMELCGGTHVARTGEVGPFLILSEGSVASGVRRIEAVTGTVAVERMLGQQRVIERTARDLRTTWDALPAAIETLQDRVRTLDRQVDRLRRQAAGAGVGELAARAESLDQFRILATRVEADTKDTLRQIGDQLRDRLPDSLILLGAVIDDRPNLLALVAPSLVERGVRAGDIVREAATVVDGRGGGRPDRAEAGGRDPARLDDALRGARPMVERILASTS